MSKEEPGRSGEGFVWTLTLVLFALGAVSLFFSFRDSATTAAAAGNSGAAIDNNGDDADPENADDPGEADGQNVEGDAAATTDVAGASTSNSFTISVSGDILIHERVAEAAATADGGYDFAPLFAPAQNLIATRDFSICHLEVPLSSTNDDLAFTGGAFRVPMELGRRLR